MENSLDKLAQHVLNKATTDAKTLYEAAVQEIEKVRTENDEKYKEMLSLQKERASLRSQKNIEEAVRQKEDRLNRERTLQANKLIDRLFEETENMLCDMSPEEFVEFYKNEIAKLNLDHKFTVLLGERTERNLSAQHREMLEIETKHCCMIIEKDSIPNQGGFVLQQYPIEYSFLFADMLDEIKNNEGPKLLKLFINGGK